MIFKWSLFLSTLLLLCCGRKRFFSKFIVKSQCIFLIMFCRELFLSTKGKLNFLNAEGKKAVREIQPGKTLRGKICLHYSMVLTQHWDLEETERKNHSQECREDFSVYFNPQSHCHLLGFWRKDSHPARNIG